MFSELSVPTIMSACVVWPFLSSKSIIAVVAKILYDTKFWKDKVLMKQFTPKIGRKCFGKCPKLSKFLK